MPSMTDYVGRQIDVIRPITLDEDGIERVRDIIALTLNLNGASSRRIARLLGRSHVDIVNRLERIPVKVRYRYGDRPIADLFGARHAEEDREPNDDDWEPDKCGEQHAETEGPPGQLFYNYVDVPGDDNSPPSLVLRRSATTRRRITQQNTLIVGSRVEIATPHGPRAASISDLRDHVIVRLRSRHINYRVIGKILGMNASTAKRRYDRLPWSWKRGDWNTTVTVDGQTM